MWLGWMLIDEDELVQQTFFYLCEPEVTDAETDMINTVDCEVDNGTEE